MCVIFSILGIIIAYILAPDWVFNIFLSVDQVGNSILGGDPTETISSRLGKWLTLEIDVIRVTIAQGVCWFLDLIDPNHCFDSINENTGDKAIIQ